MKNQYNFSEMLNATKTAIGEDKTAKLVLNLLEKNMIIPQGTTDEFMKLREELQEKRSDKLQTIDIMDRLVILSKGFNNKYAN